MQRRWVSVRPASGWWASRRRASTRGASAGAPSTLGASGTAPLRRGRTDLRLLLMAGGVVGALLLFLVLAEYAVGGGGHAIDTAILRGLRNPADPADPVGPFWLERFAIDITALGGFPVLTVILLVGSGWLALDGRWREVALLAASWLGGLTLKLALKGAFDRPRPDLVPHGVETFTSSFPSGHALMAAVVYLTLAALLARIQPTRRLRLFVVATGLALVLLIGASRVYLGVHWPSDVLAGWCIGTAWATLCWLAATRWRRAGEG